MQEVPALAKQSLLWLPVGSAWDVKFFFQHLAFVGPSCKQKFDKQLLQDKSLLSFQSYVVLVTCMWSGKTMARGNGKVIPHPLRSLFLTS